MRSTEVPVDLASRLTSADVKLQRLKEAFETFDEDENGIIDAEELMKLLAADGTEPLSKEDVIEIIQNFDESNDGKGLSWKDVRHARIRTARTKRTYLNALSCRLSPLMAVLCSFNGLGTAC